VLRLVARRVLRAIPTLVGVILVAMLLLELMPGDPARIMAGDNATPEAVEVIRQDLDLDKPVWERFGSYVWNVIQGDLGQSPGSSTPIWNRISDALPVTLSLGLVAMVIAIVIGVAAGAAAALRRGRWVDRAVTAAASVMQAVPAFVVGLALVIALAVDRSWFPASGYQPLASGVNEWLRYLFLPALALALSSAAELARQTRGALVDTLEQDYVQASRAKGMSERWVIGKHAAKNAATPVVTVAGLQVTRILGGAVVVEQIFGMHGFGSLAVNAVLTRDMVLIQGIVLVSAVGVLIVNLLVDLSYGYLNPRVRV
jgi:peptide/nickel transport system permease protein